MFLVLMRKSESGLGEIVDERNSIHFVSHGEEIPRLILYTLGPEISFEWGQELHTREYQLLSPKIVTRFNYESVYISIWAFILSITFLRRCARNFGTKE